MGRSTAHKAHLIFHLNAIFFGLLSRSFSKRKEWGWGVGRAGVHHLNLVGFCLQSEQPLEVEREPGDNVIQPPHYTNEKARPPGPGGATTALGRTTLYPLVTAKPAGGAVEPRCGGCAHTRSSGWVPARLGLSMPGCVDSPPPHTLHQ